MPRPNSDPHLHRGRSTICVWPHFSHMSDAVFATSQDLIPETPRASPPHSRRRRATPSNRHRSHRGDLRGASPSGSLWRARCVRRAACKRRVRRARASTCRRPRRRRWRRRCGGASPRPAGESWTPAQRPPRNPPPRAPRALPPRAASPPRPESVGKPRGRRRRGAQRTRRHHCVSTWVRCPCGARRPSAATLATPATHSPALYVAAPPPSRLDPLLSKRERRALIDPLLAPQ